MAENSKIEWTTHTFNPWIGCTKVSAACDHCYAEAWDKRFTNGKRWGPHASRTRTKTWGNPIKWNRQAQGAKHRPRVFCASLADVFDNHKSIQPEWRRDLWRLIENTPNLDWLLLTKRPQNVQKLCPWTFGTFPPNVWIGTTVENQVTAEQRIWHLAQIPCKIRFLSCEPLTGPLVLDGTTTPYAEAYNALTGELSATNWVQPIDWVICGGESGASARPMHPNWATSLRDQCEASDVPFFFKQWGEWGPDNLSDSPAKSLWMSTDGTLIDGGIYQVQNADCAKPVSLVVRHGKKAAGRTLDGREWNEVPT